jgi:hypothetical protein
LQQRQGWASAAVQQAKIEDEVAVRMRSYARSRARIEEEIIRRQEARRLGQPSGQLAAAAAARRVEGGGGIGDNSSSAAMRTLLHLDSQHKVSGRFGWMTFLVPVALEVSLIEGTINVFVSASVLPLVLIVSLPCWSPY